MGARDVARDRGTSRRFDELAPHAIIALAAEGDEAALALFENLTPAERAQWEAEQEAYHKAAAELEIEATRAQTQATIRRNRAAIKEYEAFRREQGRRAVHRAQRVRANTRPRPRRSRGSSHPRHGSRRGASTRTSSRGGDSGDPDEPHEQPDHVNAAPAAFPRGGGR